MIRIAARRSVARSALRAMALIAAPVAAIAASAQDSPGAALVGAYDGGQTEIAAGLELRADGRFSYALSYGALDEEAAGTWRLERAAVLLTSDPITPPRFVLLDRRDAAAGRLIVEFDVPDGMSRQYFHATIGFADGTAVDRQFGDGEPLELISDKPVATVTLTLPMYDLRGETVALGGERGQRLRFRLEPNDLGKVAFARTALRIEHGELLLARHDRDIRFRRVAAADGAR